jgi:hypothetical protein
MEWISTRIKENLPAEFQDVLLYQENNGIFVGWLENGVWIVDNTFVETDDYKVKIHGNIKQDDITYWRPLPPNPQWDFFETEYKTCEDWYTQCQKNVRIINFSMDTNSPEFKFFWKEEKVTRDTFIKRVMDCEVERL